MNLTITKETKEPAVLTLKLSGRLDTATATQFDEVFGASADGMKEIVLDFSGVEYLSSAGLRSLISASKQMKKQDGRLTVLNPQEVVREVLDMTKAALFLHIAQ